MPSDYRGLGTGIVSLRIAVVSATMVPSFGMYVTARYRLGDLCIWTAPCWYQRLWCLLLEGVLSKYSECETYISQSRMMVVSATSNIP